jgi:hypothetical protein
MFAQTRMYNVGRQLSIWPRTQAHARHCCTSCSSFDRCKRQPITTTLLPRSLLSPQAVPSVTSYSSCTACGSTGTWSRLDVSNQWLQPYYNTTAKR